MLITRERDMRTADTWLRKNKVNFEIMPNEQVLVYTYGNYSNMKKEICIESGGAGTDYTVLRLKMNMQHGDEGFLYDIVREPVYPGIKL